MKPEGWLRAQLERDISTGFPGNIDALLRNPTGAGGKPEHVKMLPMGSTLLRRTCFPKM